MSMTCTNWCDVICADVRISTSDCDARWPTISDHIHTYGGTTLMGDRLSPYLQGYIHNPELGDKIPVPTYVASLNGGQNSPQFFCYADLFFVFYLAFY